MEGTLGWLTEWFQRENGSHIQIWDFLEQLMDTTLIDRFLFNVFLILGLVVVAFVWISLV